MLQGGRWHLVVSGNGPMEMRDCLFDARVTESQYWHELLSSSHWRMWYWPLPCCLLLDFVSCYNDDRARDRWR
jgi:hypothetical protein